MDLGGGGGRVRPYSHFHTPFLALEPERFLESSPARPVGLLRRSKEAGEQVYLGGFLNKPLRGRCALKEAAACGSAGPG